jgi:predicted metal-binding protein/predicted O-methyltransferase YrrM
MADSGKQKHLPDHDPQDTGPQYLEDIATAYWLSQSLFTAVEADIFTSLDSGGATASELASAKGYATAGLERFLHALCGMGLLCRSGDRYFNTLISKKYLVSGKPDSQRESILWRKRLMTQWEGLENCLMAGGRTDCLQEEDTESLVRRRRDYIRAMDCIARIKAREILPVFKSLQLKGEMLDVGAGSGAVAAAFLEEFPGVKATLMDLPEVLVIADEFMKARALGERTSLCPADILKDWQHAKGRFDLIILSNIVHAYSENELRHIMASAADCLSEKGFLVIHDFFMEHYPQKAALFDLNMFVNTYNGMVFSQKKVYEELSRHDLHVLDPIPLGTDTALVIAAKDSSLLESLLTDTEKRLAFSIRSLGFTAVSAVPAETVHVTDWANLKCRFGCSRYGSPSCPPNCIEPERTKALLKEYSRALLLEGEPPAKAFQELVLRAEREAFTSGFHKALAFWAGPCALCEPCPSNKKCRNPRDSRPSMEAAGIDVYETVRRAGFRLRTLDSPEDFVKYYALILLE